MVGLMVCASLAYAADTKTEKAAGTTEKVDKEAPKILMFHGKIEAMVMADAAKGTKTEITVVDKEAKKMTFVVTPETKFQNAEGKEAKIEDLKKDEMVKITYMTKDNVHTAHQVRLVAEVKIETKTETKTETK